MTKRKNPKDILPGGRPTVYSDEVATIICDLLSNTTMTLQQICDSDPRLPQHQATIYRWRLTHPTFCDMYNKARQAQADVRADSVYDVVANCDGTSGSQVAKAKLMVDSIKWHTSKVLPKVYGDRNISENHNYNHEKGLKDLE